MKGNTEEITEEENHEAENRVSCPVCGETFQCSLEATLISEHINRCLDKSNQADDGENKRENDFGGHCYDELEANTLKTGETEGNCEEKVELFFCQICQKDLTRMNSQRRQQHMNSCCDKVEALESIETRQATRNTSTTPEQLICPLCNKHFKTVKTRQTHIKRCAQKKGVPLNQILQLVHDNLAHQQTTAQNQGDATQEQGTSSNQKNTRRRRKRNTSLKNLDDETQLALALSASMAPPAVPKAKGSRKGGRKKKEQSDEVPALLLRNEENMKKVIAERAAQVIFPHVCEIEGEDDEISCTPALPPSKLVKQVKNSHVTIESSKENDDVTLVEELQVENNIESKMGDVNYCDEVFGAGNEGSLNSKDTESTSEKSDEEINDDGCSDEDQLSHSNTVGASFISKSFLSFLNDDDDNEKLKPVPSKLSAPSCVLWSLTALPIEVSSLRFYVPGLLPYPLPSKEKKNLTSAKTVVQSTNTMTVSELSEDCDMEMNDSTEKVATPRRGSRDSEDVNLNVRHSVDQLTASQMASVEMLAELAYGDSPSDITMATQKLGSVKNDDSEVFPSSGFCVPVVQEDKLCQQCTGGTTQLVQDLLTMVNNPLFSDVTIVTKDNKKIFGHKLILAARCNEFNELLNTDCTMDENGKCCLYLRDMTSDVLLVVLKFLYTGLFDIPPDHHESVKIAAERFQLSELAKACNNNTCKSVDTNLQLEEDQEIPQSTDLDSLLNKVLDVTAEATDQINNEFDGQLSQDEPGFDDEDIEEIRIFQTQTVRQTKEKNSDSIRGVIETVEGPRFEQFNGIEKSKHSNYVQDLDGLKNQNINDMNCKLFETVCLKKENNGSAVKVTSTVENQNDKLRQQLITGQGGHTAVGKYENLELETEIDLVETSDQVTGQSDVFNHPEDHSASIKNSDKNKSCCCDFPSALTNKSENEVLARDNSDFHKSEGQNNFCHISDHETQNSSSELDLKKLVQSKIGARGLHVEQMSFVKYAPPNFSTECSNQLGFGDENYCVHNEDENVHQAELSSNADSSDTFLESQLICENRHGSDIENENGDDYRIKETDKKNKVELEFKLISRSDNQHCMDELFDDQAFSYQDLPSPPAAGSEMDVNDVHTESKEETSLYLVHDESICLLSGDEKVFDESFEKAEVNIVPETPATSKRPLSSKVSQHNSNITTQFQSSPPRFSTEDFYNPIGENVEGRASPDLICSGSSQNSGDQEASDFLAKLKSRANKNNIKSKKRKRDCSSPRSSLAKKRVVEEKERPGSSFLQNENKKTSGKETKLKDCQGQPRLISHTIAEAKLLSLSSDADELENKTVSFLSSPKVGGSTSNADICATSAPLNNQFSSMDLTSKLGESAVSMTTQEDIALMDRDETLCTPNFSHRASLMMSPPVPSPEYSFTPMDFSMGSPASPEVPVSTPTGNTLSLESQKRIELEVSLKEQTSPGSPGISVVKAVEYTSSPDREIPSIELRIQDESPLSPSVPLTDYSQLSKDHGKRSAVAKSISFLRSQDNSCSTLVHSSGEESDSNEKNIQIKHSPISWYRSNALSNPKNSEEKAGAKKITKQNKTRDKEVESRQDKNKEASSVNFKVGLFQRLKASKYGLNKEVESDDDCVSVESDGGETNDETDADDGDELNLPNDNSFFVNNDFDYGDGGYTCDNEFEGSQNEDKEFLIQNSFDNIDKQELPHSVDILGRTTHTSVARNKNDSTETTVPNSSIHTQKPGKNLISRNTVTPFRQSSGQTRQEGTQQTRRQLGRGAASVATKRPVTPMADYDCMNTPELKNELRSYGVRQLPKRKMVAKLKEIYHYTHQEPEIDETIFDGPPPTVSNTKISRGPKSQRLSHDIQNKVQDSSSESEIECRSSRSEVETGTTGSNQESEDESEEFGDVTMEIEDSTEEVTASQQVNNSSIQEKLREFITTNKELYLQVLQYKPLDLVVVHQQIKSSGIACSLGKLVDFLDLQGITFSTANTRQRGTRRKQKVKNNAKPRKNTKLNAR